MLDQKSPVETPITPSTPCFPPFVTSPRLADSRQASMESIDAVLSPSNPSPKPIPSQVARAVPIIRPLPLRPALHIQSANQTSRVCKLSQSQSQLYQRRSRSSSSSSRRRTGSRSPSSITIPRLLNPSPRAPQPPGPTYQNAVAHLATKLIPLISVSTGLPHPAFPRSLLQYHLLTHEQLNELAVYYHQVVPPLRQTTQYPVSIPAWVGRDGRLLENGHGAAADGVVSLETKRRRWGRFLGLRGCDSPTVMRWLSERERRERETPEERELRERLEREWRRGIERRRQEDMARAKAEGWRDRW